MTKKISRCLISVSDKTDLDKLLKVIKKYEIEIISTGGTYEFIKSKKYDCIEISEFTSFPEILDGRVKTLHPNIHGGILNIRGNKNHQDQIKKNNIKNIELVIVNLYPFEKKLSENKSFEEMIENIDIGGPSMLRSAAKNFSDVTVVSSINYYDDLIKELNVHGGATSIEFRKKMANETFNETAYYDSLISNWFSKENKIKFPNKKTISGKLVGKLRYGENPHQTGALYSVINNNNFSNFDQLMGKEMSYNNYLDAFNAFELISEFKNGFATAIIKHNNPCGCSYENDGLKSYLNAFNADPKSAFGGVVAFNFKIEENLASELVKTFYEVILAPDVSKGAISILSTKKNLRVIKTSSTKIKGNLDYKILGGVLLSQDNNEFSLNKDELKIVTNKKPSDKEFEDLLFAERVCKHVKSNAIVIAKNNKTIGIGAGQTSRVASCKIAVDNSLEFTSTKDVTGSVAASDAFFPFADGIKKLIDLGVTSIIQPGGSIRDKEVIEEANKRNVSMVFTNRRNFKH